MHTLYTGSIYLIVNTINNKKYVGQTTQTVEARFKHSHIGQVCNGQRKSAYGYL